MKKEIKKNSNGFTLVEVIISIAVLSLICAIGLRLFVLSNDVSKNAHDKDMASLIAMDAIEICKNSDAPRRVLEHAFFEKAQVVESDDLVIVNYYDKDWQILSELPVDIADKTVFKMILTITGTSEKNAISENLSKEADDGFIVSQLYDISVSVKKMKLDDLESKILAQYESSKYFVFKE